MQSRTPDPFGIARSRIPAIIIPRKLGISMLPRQAKVVKRDAEPGVGSGAKTAGIRILRPCQPGQLKQDVTKVLRSFLSRGSIMAVKACHAEDA